MSLGIGSTGASGTTLSKEIAAFLAGFSGFFFNKLK